MKIAVGNIVGYKGDAEWKAEVIEALPGDRYRIRYISLSTPYEDYIGKTQIITCSYASKYFFLVDQDLTE